MTEETPIITTETPQEEVITPNWESICEEQYKQLQEYEFFSNQILFNKTLFQGFNILLDKLTKIEEKLLGNQK